jgi:hypothetical protein
MAISSLGDRAKVRFVSVKERIKKVHPIIIDVVVL